jgi:hypothetical protein
MNFTSVKSVFFKTLIGCLIAAAGVAVVTVLVGKFNDVTGKALFTIAIIALHSLVSISFIENNEKQDTFESLAVFTNATFGIIVLSFITAILGLWHVIPGELVARLYGLYFVLIFAILHGEVLAKTMGKQANIDTTVRVNFFFMAIVVVMLLPVIFLTAESTLSSLYYRGLAAAGIIDATLTLSAVILHTLYVQKHPKIVDPVFSIQQVPVPGGQPGQMMQVQVPQLKPKRHMNGFVVLLLGFVALQLISGIILGILGAINR